MAKLRSFYGAVRTRGPVQVQLPPRSRRRNVLSLLALTCSVELGAVLLRRLERRSMYLLCDIRKQSGKPVLK